MLSDERIRQIAEDIYCSEGTRAEIEHSIRAALAEAAQAYEQRIRELEAQRVPEGWSLVPIYPTSDMLSAFDHCDAQGCQFAETYWDTMLAAAPAPKKGE